MARSWYKRHARSPSLSSPKKPPHEVANPTGINCNYASTGLSKKERDEREHIFLGADKIDLFFCNLIDWRLYELDLSALTLLVVAAFQG
jgi:hypothetical protein